jgi:uncharacterized protein (TIGR00369 family)
MLANPGKDMTMATKKLKWDADQIDAFLRQEFPQAFAGGADYRIGTLRPGHVSVYMTAGDKQLRPGGTVSGPALMEFVDFSIYVLLLAHHKESARLSVTTNLQISFLRKAEPGELRCDVELIKHGRTLSVAASRIAHAQSDRLIAHSEATYYMGEAQ